MPEGIDADACALIPRACKLARHRDALRLSNDGATEGLCLGDPHPSLREQIVDRVLKVTNRDVRRVARVVDPPSIL